MAKTLSYGSTNTPAKMKGTGMATLGQAGNVGQVAGQPRTSASEAIRLRQLGYTQRADGTWVAPPSAAYDPITNPNPSSTRGTASTAWDGTTAGLSNMRTNQTNMAPAISKPSSVISSLSTGGGGGGVTTGSPVTSVGANAGGATATGANASTGNGAYLRSLLGGDPGNFAGGYAEDQINSLLQDPGAMARGAAKFGGFDPNGGGTAVMAEDTASLAPLMAYLNAQGNDIDPNSMFNNLGALALARGQAGGSGAIDEQMLNQILNPQSMSARAMVGMGNGEGVGDLAPDQQAKATNSLLGSALDVAANPWAGQALSRFLSSAASGYGESAASQGLSMSDPYVTWLRNQGFSF